MGSLRLVPGAWADLVGVGADMAGGALVDDGEVGRFGVFREGQGVSTEPQGRGRRDAFVADDAVPTLEIGRPIGQRDRRAVAFNSLSTRRSASLSRRMALRNCAT